MKLLSELHSSKVMLCLAGNLCSPELAYSHVTVTNGFQKVYADYLDESGNYDVDGIAEELGTLIRKHPETHFVLNGYSAGGVIALGTAAKFPDLVSGLVLSNTGPCSIGHGNPNFPTELYENFGNEEYIKSFLNSCFAKPIPAELTEQLWDFAKQKKAAAAVEISKTLRHVDYREALKQYKNPVQIIHGRKDMRRKLDSVEMMQQCMPQAAVCFLETGHTPMYEDAEHYNQVLSEFLTKFA